MIKLPVKFLSDEELEYNEQMEKMGGNEDAKPEFERIIKPIWFLRIDCIYEARGDGNKGCTVVLCGGNDFIVPLTVPQVAERIRAAELNILNTFEQ